MQHLEFLFGFSKSGLWKVHCSMHKSDIKEISVTKTCSQKNVKFGSGPTKRLAESQTSANLVQSLSYSKQSYGLNWFHIKYLPFWRFYPETHERFWVWILSLVGDRCQNVLLQEACSIHACRWQSHQRPKRSSLSILERTSDERNQCSILALRALSLFHFKEKRGGSVSI